MTEHELDSYLEELESQGAVIFSVDDDGIHYEIWYAYEDEEVTEIFPKGYQRG